MRYFFFLPSAESLLAGRVGVATTACRAVNNARSAHAVMASERGALTGAIVVSPITVATDKNLATATGAQVVAGTDHIGLHRPMRAGFSPYAVRY